LVFIDLPPFSPIPCSVNADHVAAVCKSHGHDAVINPSDAVISVLFGAMSSVFRNNTVRIKKGPLGYSKRNIVFREVFFTIIPYQRSKPKAIFKYGNLYG
jgi:hypothetical protein